MAESTVDILFRLKDETQQGLRQIKTGVEDVNQSLEETDNQNFDGLIAAIAAVEKKTQSLVANINEAISAARNAALIFAAKGAALASPFLIGASAAGEFQVEIAEIGTLVDDAVVSNDRLTKSVLALSTEFGADKTEVASAMYQAISSGAGAGAEANELLAVALLTARGGVTDVRTAVDGLTTVINAFGLEMSDAEDVADSMFITVKGGRTTIDELARSLFQAAPLASQLGVTFSDLNGVIAAVTLQGTPTAVAMTQIRAALTSLLSGTEGVNKALKGFSSASDAIKKIGIVKTFQLLRDAAGGSDAKLREMLGSSEALNFVLSITGDNLQRVNEKLADQEDRLGAAAAAADEVSQAYGVQMEIALNRISNAFTALGLNVLPVLLPPLRLVSELFRRLTIVLTDNNLAGSISRLVFGFGLLVTALGLFAAAVLTIGKVFLISKVFSAGRLGMAAIVSSISRAAGSATLSLNLLKAAGVSSGAALGGATIAAKGLNAALFIMKRAIPVIGIALTVLSIGALVLADDFDEMSESAAQAKANIDALSGIKRVEWVAKTTGEVDRLNTLLAEQKEKVLELAREMEEGGVWSVVATFRIEGAQAAVEKTQAELDKITADRDFFTVSVRDIDPDTISVAQDKENREEIGRLTLAILDAKEALEQLKAEADEPVPEIQYQLTPGAPGVAPTFFRQEEEKQGERTDEEKERIKALEKEIELLGVKYIQLGSINNRRDESIRKRKEEAERLAAEQKAQEAANRYQKGASERGQLLRAQQRLREDQDKAELADTLTKNEVIRQDYESRYKKIEISAEEYYAKLRILAEEDNAAQIALIDNQIAALDAAKASAIENANARAKLADPESKGASQVVLDTIDVDFQAQEVRLRAKLAELKANLASDMAGIAEDAAEAGIAGVTAAIDAIEKRLETGRAAITIRLEAGLINESQAAAEVVALEQSINRELEEQLALLIAIQAAGFGGAALEAELARLKALLKQTGNELSTFSQQLRVQLDSALTDFFDETLRNLDNIGEAFDEMIHAIGASIRRLIAQKLSDKLLDSLFGGKSVLGGFLSIKDGGAVSAAKGGYIAAASGGYVNQAVVGERYVRAKDGGIVKMTRKGYVRVPVSPTVLPPARTPDGAAPTLSDKGSTAVLGSPLSTEASDRLTRTVNEYTAKAFSEDRTAISTDETAKSFSERITKALGMSELSLSDSTIKSLSVDASKSFKEDRALSFSEGTVKSLSEDIARTFSTDISKSLNEDGVRTFSEVISKSLSEDLAKSFSESMSASKTSTSEDRSISESVVRTLSENAVQALVNTARSSSDTMESIHSTREEVGPPDSDALKLAAGGGVRPRIGSVYAPMGGAVSGPGTSTSDSIRAFLSDGEYVVNARAVKEYGVEMLEAINRRKAPKLEVDRFSITKARHHHFAEGGSVSPPTGASIASAVSAGASSGGAAEPSTMNLHVSENALNMTMRDFLEREFGNIIATR